MKLKKGFLRSLIILVNIGVIVGYVITCLIPFINTSKYWFLAFPGLIFPLVLAALIGFIILWLLLKSRWWIVNFIILLLGYQQIAAVFAFNLPGDFSEEKKPNTLRVFQWNASNWAAENTGPNKPHASKSEMFELIGAKNADVLCVQEYYENYTPDGYEENIKLIYDLGYKYHYFVPTVSYPNDFKSGIAIFSKYPIIDSAQYAFRADDRSEHLIYADIKVEDKVFRVFSTHLQSVKFVESDYRSLSRIRHAEKPDLRGSKKIVYKLRSGYVSRYNETELVSEKLRESPYPAIICGDFNDVPNSRTYFRIRGDMTDAFIKKGWGIGRTFLFISPTLRIDYIFADKRLEVDQFQIIDVPYSAHYPLVTDLLY